jgi:hypothetical protein
MNTDNNNPSSINDLLEWVTAADIELFSVALPLLYVASLCVRAFCLELYNQKTDIDFYTESFKNRLLLTENEEHLCWLINTPSVTSPYIQISKPQPVTSPYWIACVERGFIPSYAAELTFVTLLAATFWLILLKNLISATCRFINKISSAAHPSSIQNQFSLFKVIHNVCKFSMQHSILAGTVYLCYQLYFELSKLEINKHSRQINTDAPLTTRPANPQFF